MSGRPGTFVLLQAALPGRPVHNIGVLLADPERDRLFIRVRERFDDIADEEDCEVLEALEDDIRRRVTEMGAGEYLRWLAETASNSIRVSEPEAVAVDSFTRVLERLFDRHVERVQVEPYRTHLPLFSARVAAGSFSPEQAIDEEPEDWVPAPVRAARDLFVVRVTGRSMEPRIPAGSLNVFRANPAGSRHGKIVLVELLNVRDDAARYTVKRYTSVKRARGDGQWEHERIRLEPLNPEYEAWDLAPGDLKVIGEWVCTLD
jgi:SOS-response transcriptional repressor LexA